MRKDLVHVAGCAHGDECPERFYAFRWPMMVRDARALGVRIPRSLNRRWPR